MPKCVSRVNENHSYCKKETRTLTITFCVISLMTIETLIEPVYGLYLLYLNLAGIIRIKIIDNTSLWDLTFYLRSFVR